MQAYLHATRRGPVARAADEAAAKGFLSADVGAEYDELIEIVSARGWHLLWSLNWPSHETGSIENRAHDQWAVYSRSSDTLVQICIVCSEKRLGG